MTVVTVGADRGVGIPASDGFRMDTLSIGQEWPIADAAPLHHRLVTVTLAAGLSNGRSIDGRIGIACRQDSRQVAGFRMAIKTRGSFCSFSNRQRVEATVVVAVRSSMEEIAAEIWKGLFGTVTTLTLERWLGGIPNFLTGRVR